MSKNKKTPQDVLDQGEKKSLAEWIEENLMIFFSVPIALAMVLIGLALLNFSLKLQ
ncbi:hypothetical protein [Turicibacter sanguinis]|uniref:hypothetical protein n=1 Tax=Turicibacter sanguinis TaxID=154288 RepID=UPI0006C632C0|nr:hypothetical protein [Turicibacter sanguinis]CUN14671.1 Uncharacterised protein [Turicibacter sanguinis]